MTDNIPDIPFDQLDPDLQNKLLKAEQSKHAMIYVDTDGYIITPLSPSRALAEFNEVFEIPTNTTGVPAIPDNETVALRLRLLSEEYYEMCDSITERNLVEFADALADMVYIIYGTAAVYGIDLDAVFAEVHRSNMEKVVDGVVLRRPDGKVLKPEGWQPPQIAKVLGIETENDK